MNDRVLATLLALGLGATGCGGGNGNDDGTGGSSAGGMGGANGGSAGVGGTAPVDTTAPDFAGATAANIVSETRLEVTWDAANDDLSPGSRIAYRVYMSTTAGGHDFSRPFTTTSSGSATAFLSDLDPDQDYFFIVRAVDEAGNEDGNSVEVSATTPDTSPPKFPGLTAMTALTSRSLMLEWRPAADTGADEAQLQYNVYLSPLSGAQDFGAPPTATSAPGETTLIIDTGINPETQYFAVVHAVDPTGNEDDNTVERGVTTPEGNPPTFAGLRYAISAPDAVNLYWTPANDLPDTETANLVYDVFASTSSMAQDFSAPVATTPPGVFTHAVMGLPADTEHFFIVRARDPSGNLDNNRTERRATPIGTDTVAPNFAGATAAMSNSPSSIEVTWAAATDNKAAANDIAYDVYVSAMAGGQDFSSPTFSTRSGATSATIAGLNPGASRSVVVRARDQAGNRDGNSMEVTAAALAKPTPADTTAPTFTGAPTAMRVDTRPDSLDVAWVDATDDTVAAADIRYHICVEVNVTDCVGAAFLDHIAFTTDFGDLSARVNKLRTRTNYEVFVRAEDRNGNMETGNNSAQATTATSWQNDVLPLLQAKCNACHDFQTIPSLSNVPSSFADASLVGTFPPDGQLPFVRPGQPELSMIYRKVNAIGIVQPPFSVALPNDYLGNREPRDGGGLGLVNELSAAENGTIRDWIEQGALGN